MMMEEIVMIQENTVNLIDSMKKTSVYQEYHEALAELENRPELKLKADEFRKERYRVYHVESSLCCDAMDLLAAKQEEVMQYLEIKRFLKAELELARFMQSIETQLMVAMQPNVIEEML